MPAPKDCLLMHPQRACLGHWTVRQRTKQSASFHGAVSYETRPCLARTTHAIVMALEMSTIIRKSQAADGGVNQPQPAHAMAECCALLDAQLAAFRDGSDKVHLINQLRDVIARFAALSRQSQLAPEHALVLFKTTLHQLHTTAGWPTME